MPDPGAAPLGSNHEKSKASKVVSDSHLEEPEGSPINLGLEMNLSINHVQVVGQGTAEYTTQDTFNTFISDDYAFKEEMQSTVNGLSLELSIKELLLNMVPTKDPNLDHTQAQYLCKNPGPVEGPAPLMSVQKNLPGPWNQSEADDEESMERIPHYLKGKNVAKGTWE